MTLPRSCTSRVEWAEKQLDTLKSEIGYFIKDNSHTTDTSEDPKTGEKIVVVWHPDPPDEFSLQASEILHHLRSALDSLVFNLAGCPDDRHSTLLFPIFALEGSYINHEKAYLKGIGSRATAIIERLQPYVVPDDWQWPWPYAPEEQPLMLLHDFNRVDKHRTLRILVPSVERLRIRGTSEITDDKVRLGIQERDAAVLRVPAEMDVEVHPTFSVAFENTWPTRGAEVLACLNALLSEVRDRVLPLFGEFFDDSGIVIAETP